MMHTANPFRTTANLFAVVLIGATGAMARQAPPASTPPAEKSVEKSKDAPPSLDDLLGIKKDQQAQPEKQDDDIIKKLTGESGGRAGADVAALFLEAADSMSKSASLLLEQRSAGLATQRFQEAALLKLDTLISQAQQQSKQQQKQQQQQQQQNAPQQQQAQQPTNPSGPTSTSEVGDHNMALRQTDLNGAIDEKRSEWGNLPPRVRELLRQGRGDAAARLYQRLTEIYYQRLAEESQP